MSELMFEPTEVRMGRFRVDWIFANEGRHGTYNPGDAEDRPLLRFTCCMQAHAGNFLSLPQGSYLTELPVSTHPDRLLTIARRLIEILQEDWPHTRLPDHNEKLPYEPRLLNMSYVGPDNFAIPLPQLVLR